MRNQLMALTMFMKAFKMVFATLRLLAAVIGIQAACLTLGASESVPSFKNPHQVLKLTSNEYSILNESEADGLLKYGGSGDFQVTMAKEGNDVTWTVTLDNPRQMELLGIFVGEKTVKLVQGLDPDSIDPSEKVALAAIKSLTQKMEYARKNPVWDSIQLSGLVVQQGTNWVIQSGGDFFTLVGGQLEALKSLKENLVVAHGFVKAPGQFEVASFVKKKDNTLELFVMSLCPFGQKAEAQLLAFMDSTNAMAKPKIEIHYIFYKQPKEGKDVFTTLHGEAEMVEDLVQMAIRDHYPQIFQIYLRVRATDDSTPWQQLVGNLGLRPADEAAIEKLITTRQDEMIQTEYNYAVQYGITDGSPAYVWESEPVSNLNKIRASAGLEASKEETCSQ
jgi:hypothetical protein